MALNINLDETSLNEINELSNEFKISKSKLIRRAINEFYLKERRAKENLLFFVDLYNKSVIDKDTLFLLLPRNDAESVIIGSRAGKEAVKLVGKINN